MYYYNHQSGIAGFCCPLKRNCVVLHKWSGTSLIVAVAEVPCIVAVTIVEL